MDQIRTGEIIRSMRLNKKMTQAALAEKIGVSDKAVSKWERGCGAPDVSILPLLAAELGIDMVNLINGEMEENELINGNMKKTRFYVCPDCGAPYHRDCYEKLGRCIHSPAHAAGYEWKFPYQESELCTCPACGERTLRSESVCRCCGAALPPEGAQEPADRADSDEHSEEFDYSTFYRQFQETGAPQVDPLRQTYQAAFGKEEVMDGIPCKDWADFIGPASPAYLSAYCRMQLSHTKTSMSFSAMLFGPFYFFYRKAWKPAFAFLAAELVLALPTFIDLLQVTDSSLSPGLSTSTLLTLSRVCSVLSFLLMIVRGLYGKWLYRQSAAEKIRRIRAEFPDAAQRKAVLCAQGGTSWAAVLGCLVLLMVIGSAFTLLLGPNVDALIHLVYG